MNTVKCPYCGTIVEIPAGELANVGIIYINECQSCEKVFKIGVTFVPKYTVEKIPVFDYSGALQYTKVDNTESKNTMTRDWSEDFGLENGNYIGHCVECGSLFSGHKRRTLCKICASKGEAKK